jgi:hypothetical protein
MDLADLVPALYFDGLTVGQPLLTLNNTNQYWRCVYLLILCFIHFLTL